MITDEKIAALRKRTAYWCLDRDELEELLKEREALRDKLAKARGTMGYAAAHLRYSHIDQMSRVEVASLLENSLKELSE